MDFLLSSVYSLNFTIYVEIFLFHKANFNILVAETIVRHIGYKMIKYRTEITKLEIDKNYLLGICADAQARDSQVRTVLVRSLLPLSHKNRFIPVSRKNARK